MKIYDLRKLPLVILNNMEIAALNDKIEILNIKFRELVNKNDFNIRYNNQNHLDDLFKLIVEADPTKNKSYLQWIVTKGISKWRNKPHRLWDEDLRKLHNDLELYDTLKRKNKLKPEHKDINRIKDHIELFKLLQGYDTSEEILSKNDERKAKELEYFNKKEAKLVVNNSTWKIVIPKTQEASCFFGINTQWCTAAKKDNMFKHYNDIGNLYIILHKPTNKRWQFHIVDTDVLLSEESELETAISFMDENDREVDFKKFTKQYPDVFNKYIKFDNFTEDEKMNILSVDPLFILYLKKPSKKLWNFAIKESPFLIMHIKKPSEEQQLSAIFHDPHFLRFISNPTKKVIETALKQDSYVLEHLYSSKDIKKYLDIAIKIEYETLQSKEKVLNRFTQFFKERIISRSSLEYVKEKIMN